MFYTVDEVAKKLSVTPRTIRNRAAKNGIGQKVGRDWIFADDDLKKLEETPTVGRPVTTGARAKRKKKAKS